MSRVVVALLVTATLAGCRLVPVTARPSALSLRREELALAGFARVEVDQGGTIVVDAVQRIDVIGTDLVRREVSIGELVAGCAGDAHGPSCRAGPIRVGTRRELDTRQLVIGLFGLATTIVGVACLTICSDPDPSAAAGVALGVVTLAYPLSTVF